jgi:hypothetical protein
MINRPNISQLITSKYGRPASSVGVSGIANREARNEAYRASVDSLMDQQPEYRQDGGGFFSGIYDYVKNIDPNAADGESLFRDFSQALNPKTYQMLEGVFNSPEESSVNQAEAAVANAPEAVNSPISTAIPSSTTATVVEETEEPTTGARISEGLSNALKAILPKLLKMGVGIGVQNAYKFEPTQYAMSNTRKKSAQPIGINVNPISGSGFKDGGSLLGRDLYLGGGEITGPGGPKEDLVPIWASDDEYVVSADAVTRLGNGDHAKGIAALDRINFG